MRLLLIRHARAALSSGIDESGAELTAQGRTDARAVGERLAGLEPRLAAVLSSPKTRALQTAAILASCYSPQTPAVEPQEKLCGDALDVAWLSSLFSSRAADETVALVGHEPDMGALLYFLSGRTAEFPKGAAACVEFSGPFRPGAGKLVYFLSPDDPRPNPK